MEFYDLLQEGCISAVSLESALGFKKLLIAGKDFILSDVDARGAKEGANALVGKDTKRLAKSSRYGVFIIPRSLSIDRFLISHIRDSGAVLCLPLDSITSTYGFVRSRNLRMLRSLHSYASSKRVRIAIASFASSERFMNSREQLLSLATLISGSEEVAREEIEANKLVLEGKSVE
ncbi:MAG: hypothetical protein QXR58_01995 [Candidatus Micrarchaeaceae archaeon]